MNRPWNQIEIIDCNEELVDIKSLFRCIEPHPYLVLGAPYGDQLSPWRLREGVLKRLLLAESKLQELNPRFCLAIYDAWRPISVQEFMVDYAIQFECNKRGIDRLTNSHDNQLKQVLLDVQSFWAPPSRSPLKPPPHSTGAAVDLTLAEKKGPQLDMGGEIDTIGDISSPNYFINTAKKNPSTKAIHERRCLLSSVMLGVGFVQHPNEWWHYSFGDQLWAWKNNFLRAIYGCYQ